MDGITTLAGHTEGNADGTGAQAGLRRPSALCVDPAGYCLVSDTGNSIVRRISAAGEVDTLRPMLGPGEDADGSGTVFRQPRGLAADALHLYVADSKLHRILRVALGGDFCGVAPGRVLAGHGCRGFKDGTEALFNGPRGLALAIDGRLFIADSGNYRIRCLHFDGSNVLVSHICVCTYTCMHIRSHERMHACLLACMHVPSCTYVYACIYTDTGRECGGRWSSALARRRAITRVIRIPLWTVLGGVVSSWQWFKCPLCEVFLPLAAQDRLAMLTDT